MTPSTEPFNGMSLLVLACHRECSPSSANSTTACKHACSWMMESARVSSTWGKVSGEDACLRYCCSTCFLRRYARVTEKRFLADAAITDNMMQLQRKEEGEKKGTLRTGKVGGRRGKEGEEGAEIVGYMLYEDDAGIVSRSSKGLDEMMTVIVTACSSFGLHGLRRKNRDFVPGNQRRGEGVLHKQCSRPGIKTNNQVCVLERGYHRRRRKLSTEVTRRLQRAWACFQRYKMEMFDRPGVRLRLKGLLLKAEVVETLL